MIEQGRSTIGELGSALRSLGPVGVRLMMRRTDKGFCLVTGIFEAGEAGTGFEEAKYDYGRVAFVHAVLDGSTVADWLAAENGKVDGLEFSLPEPSPDCLWQRTASRAPGRYGTRLTVPHTEHSLALTKRTEPLSHGIPLAGAGRPYFPNEIAAAGSLLLDEHSAPANRSIPSEEVLVRIAHPEAYIGEVRVSSAAITISVLGENLEDVHLQVSSAGDRHEEPVREAGKIAVPISGADRADAWVALVRGQELLDVRTISSRWPDSLGRPGIVYEPDDLNEMLDRLRLGGESETVEFKEDFPKGEGIPRTVAAFANGAGGTKTVRGALQGNRQVGFLWSRGPTEDTGYGKTALMRESVRKINADLGAQVQAATGMRDDRIVPIVGAFSEVNTTTRTGLYPVLFNAVVGMARDAESPLLRAWERICDAIGDDSPQSVAAHLIETRLTVAPTSSALRSDLLQVFTETPDQVPAFLGSVSSASQIRNGLQYLDFALIALAAAGVRKVFLMIDQLEDLATNKTLSRARRQREIGRIRDLMETEPYASMLHMTFTFHSRAARELDTFWEENRLPSFEDTPSNRAAVVALRGLQDNDQVEALLRVWLDAHRVDASMAGDMVPFADDALTALRAVSGGRPGVLLNRANELFQAGADAQKGLIDGTFAREYFDGTGYDAASPTVAGDEPSSDLADLLA